MSKIGRKPIDVANVQVNIKDNIVNFKGPKSSGSYTLPELLQANVAGDKLTLTPKKVTGNVRQREINREWGLHRALLSNMLTGAKKDFEKQVDIVGLGYKAVQAGNKLTFTIGFSHKIDFSLPKGISVSIDKTGQKLTFLSPDNELLGLVCTQICALRRPEPYKGTGIKLSDEYIVRKEAKGK
jgi:large subunit ribosomal protein L6